MDAQRRDQVTDEALDRELQALLDAGPSPDFVARVRTRLANEPSASRAWFGTWRIFGYAIASAVIAFIAVAVSREVRDSASSSQPPLVSRTVTLPAAPAPMLRGRTRPDVDHAAVARPRAAAAHNAPPATPAQPEILIDPREAATLRALIFGTRNGRIDLRPVLAATTPAVMELPPVTDIEIPAITIDPIAPGTGEEGVRQ